MAKELPPKQRAIKVRSILPDDESHWLSLRDDMLTSTDASALFGLSPYSTKFELYHHHKNGIKVPFVGGSRVDKGSRMEAYAAKEVGLQEGREVRPKKDFMICDDERIGSSFDWEIMGENGWELLEIKAVDYFRHKDTWTEEEATEYVECQAQWQMMISGHDVCNIAAFTGIYDYSLIRRERDQEFIDALRSAAASFWVDVEAGREPDPDFARDDAVIALLHKGAAGDKVDKTDDAEFQELLARYDIEKSTEREYAAKAKATKAEIHHSLGDDPGAFTENYRVTAGWTKDQPGRPAKPGEIVGGSSPYRQCLVKFLGAK